MSLPTPSVSPRSIRILDSTMYSHLEGDPSIERAIWEWEHDRTEMIWCSQAIVFWQIDQSEVGQERCGARHTVRAQCDQTSIGSARVSGSWAFAQSLDPHNFYHFNKRTWWNMLGDSSGSEFSHTSDVDHCSIAPSDSRHRVWDRNAARFLPAHHSKKRVCCTFEGLSRTIQDRWSELDADWKEYWRNKINM